MNLMRLSSLRVAVCGCLAISGIPVSANDEFLGRWALTIPGDRAGWMEITRHDGWYDGSTLWGGGSVVPLASVYFDDGLLHVTRVREVKRGTDGEPGRVQHFTEAITAKLDGDELELQHINPRNNGQSVDRASFTGMRVPPLPPRPNLDEVEFGDPIELFNGKDLTGWLLTDSDRTNGWKMIDNQPVAGCTGGALWSDETRPGPIFLQGDHGPADFRNLVLRPVRR